MEMGAYGTLSADHRVVEVKDMEKYMAWLASGKGLGDEDVGDDLRRVGHTEVGRDYRVSTVFLGIYHYGGWFETMVFGPIHEEIQIRYETWDEAVAGHRAAVATAEGMK